MFKYNNVFFGILRFSPFWRNFSWHFQSSEEIYFKIRDKPISPDFPVCNQCKCQDWLVLEHKASSSFSDLLHGMVFYFLNCHLLVQCIELESNVFVFQSSIFSKESVLQKRGCFYFECKASFFSRFFSSSPKRVKTV